MSHTGRIAIVTGAAQGIGRRTPAESGFVNGHALLVNGGWSTDGSWESLRLRKR